MVIKKVWFPVLLVLIALVSYLITVHVGSPKLNNHLLIEVAPGSSTITLDGHKMDAGTITVTAGNHSIVVSRQGFGTKTQKTTAIANQTVYVGVILQPDSPDTKNWYSNHTEDKRLIDGIGSHQADYQNKVALQAIPFLKLLPVLYGNGHGGTTNISLGVPIEPSTLPAVYVTAKTSQDRQNVVTYIKSRGYDLAGMDLVFYTLDSPLKIQGSQ